MLKICKNSKFVEFCPSACLFDGNVPVYQSAITDSSVCPFKELGLLVEPYLQHHSSLIEVVGYD